MKNSSESNQRRASRCGGCQGEQVVGGRGVSEDRTIGGKVRGRLSRSERETRG